MRSLRIPPPRPVATLRTRTPKRSIRFFTASIPPLRPNAKVPIRFSTKVRSSSNDRSQVSRAIRTVHNLEETKRAPQLRLQVYCSMLMCFQAKVGGHEGIRSYHHRIGISDEHRRSINSRES